MLKAKVRLRNKSSLKLRRRNRRIVIPPTMSQSKRKESKFRRKSLKMKRISSK
jgi:hypothetical protein